jgi:predicted CXXCH cytochrome family protein
MRAILFIALLLFFSAGAAFSEDIPSIKRDCGICHVSHMGGMLLKKPLSELCIGCHPDRVEADHRVDMVPSMEPEELCGMCHKK